MDSYGKASRFVYNPNADPRPGDDDAFSGILEIRVHHARNIHNICIYDNQDVYAKFSLTYNPDETTSTRIVNGGGRNPEFNQDLAVEIGQADAVLKCEIWMMSRAKSYMDDQLLGFVLVPISSVFGRGKVTQDYDLSSTDLFHSPAGTIKLSLTLNAETPPLLDSYRDLLDSHPSVTSELMMDKSVPPEEYSRLEFPDMNVVAEEQQMVSQFFAKTGVLGSFLHLGAAPDDDAAPVEDYDMAGNSSDEFQADSASPDGSIQNSGFLSSTMTSLSDDPNSGDSMEEKKAIAIIADDPGSMKKPEYRLEGTEDMSQELNKKPVSIVRSLNVDAEESAMQQQIVDMYMRSMHQFTESLAKMKLPMDLDKARGDGGKDPGRGPDMEVEIEDKKKDNSRVFYGSRAFF